MGRATGWIFGWRRHPPWLWDNLFFFPIKATCLYNKNESFRPDRGGGECQQRLLQEVGWRGKSKRCSFSSWELFERDDFEIRINRKK